MRSCWATTLVLTNLWNLWAWADSGVKGPPHVIGSVPPRQIFKSSGDIVLRCPIQATPPPIIEWLKDGESITAGWDRYKATNQGLKIRQALPDDSGLFTCKGVNGFGSEQVSFHVIVVDPSGTTTELPLVLVDSDTDGESTLNRIQGVIPTWTELSRPSHSLIQLPVGATLRLKCVADGDPIPRLTWTRDGIELPFERKNGPWTLVLNSVSEEDSGSYTCKAMNAYGSINATFQVEVIERNPMKPELDSLYPMNQTLIAGDTARFQCRIHSDDVPFLQWLKRLNPIDHYNGDSHPDTLLSTEGVLNVRGWRYKVLRAGKPALQNEDGTYIDKLTLSDITSADEGVYICVATNSVGFTFKEAALKVMSPAIQNYDLVPAWPSTAVIALPAACLGLILFVAISVYCVKNKQSKASPISRHPNLSSADTKDLSTTPCLLPTQQNDQRSSPGGGIALSNARREPDLMEPLYTSNNRAFPRPAPTPIVPYYTSLNGPTPQVPASNASTAVPSGAYHNAYHMPNLCPQHLPPHPQVWHRDMRSDYHTSSSGSAGTASQWRPQIV